MINAKEEFLSAINNKVGRSIKCASMQLEKSYDERVQKTLPLNYTSDEYNTFLDSLDFRYDNGYGGQELFGTVWFDDATWLSRGEYDGSEWWEHNVLPEIPNECLNPLPSTKH